MGAPVLTGRAGTVIAAAFCRRRARQLENTSAAQRQRASLRLLRQVLFLQGPGLTLPAFPWSLDRRGCARSRLFPYADRIVGKGTCTRTRCRRARSDPDLRARRGHVHYRRAKLPARTTSGFQVLAALAAGACWRRRPSPGCRSRRRRRACALSRQCDRRERPSQWSGNSQVWVLTLRSSAVWPCCSVRARSHLHTSASWSLGRHLAREPARIASEPAPA